MPIEVSLRRVAPRQALIPACQASSCGGRSGAYEKELRKAREIAFEELGSQARALGADAVVGIDIDYETVGQNGSMLMVSVSGTAVKTRR